MNMFPNHETRPKWQISIFSWSLRNQRQVDALPNLGRRSSGEDGGGVCYNYLGMSKEDKESKRSVWQPSPKRWRKIKPLAREMRRKPTMAERKLWKRIRRKQVLGVKFRRQMAIDHFIVDFCCPSIRLIIEIDGPTHDDTEEADALRQARLESLGFEVKRFTNRDVLSNIEGVLESVYDVVGRKIRS
jgi:very-short-patch-repair endonuclease